MLTALALGLSGCGAEAVSGAGESAGSNEPPTAEQQERALAAGFDVGLVYVSALEGYQVVAGGSGVYGADGYQTIYASPSGDDLRLTVERRSLDDRSCAALPIPAAEPFDAEVKCTRDGEGWSRVSGDRNEFAVAHDDVLVRVSGKAANADLLRTAAEQARPATAEEVEAILPAAPEAVSESTPGDAPDETVTRGDIHGDNAPDNSVGAGG
ncbi:hypothetical protein GCM10027456_59490 [Kineosporia babensis]